MRVYLFILTGALLVHGCAPNGADGSSASLPSADALYPIGFARDDIHPRGSLGRKWLRETEPEDEFARLTVRQMVGMGKARPISYERFAPAHEPGVMHTDYVFYDSHGRIIYVARKTDRG
ncbi:MAG TPA: hypothetical protein VEA69_15390 [Tepidisphaeraceae bacterium]|nr:hypothetical protein [Tepidisphaeraceae bacterium]